MLYPAELRGLVGLKASRIVGYGDSRTLFLTTGNGSWDGIGMSLASGHVDETPQIIPSPPPPLEAA